MQKRSIGYSVAIGLLLVGGLGSAALADRAREMGGPKGPFAMPFMAEDFDFDAVDADKDGKLTAAEIKAFRAAQLKAVDADGNGVITADELVAAQLKQAEARFRAGADRMLQDLDADGDGTVALAELIGGAPPRFEGKMMARIDTDGDGAISKPELDAAKARMAERGPRGGPGKPWHGGPDRGPRHGHGHGPEDGPAEGRPGADIPPPPPGDEPN